jgi:hypothetical protein
MDVIELSRWQDGQNITKRVTAAQRHTSGAVSDGRYAIARAVHVVRQPLPRGARLQFWPIAGPDAGGLQSFLKSNLSYFAPAFAHPCNFGATLAEAGKELPEVPFCGISSAPLDRSASSVAARPGQRFHG